MSKVLDASVHENDGQWDFRCPGVAGSPCGDQGTPFVSTGWPTKKAALARGQQHFDEHKLGFVIQDAVRAALAEAEDPETVDVNAVRAQAVQSSELNFMQELHEFRRDQGLVVVDGSAVSAEDI